MMSSNNWSLTGDVVDAYVMKDDRVCLASSGNKPIRTAMKKFLKDENYTEHKAVKNSFKMKIDMNGEVLVNSSELDGSKWYRVVNFLKESTKLAGIGRIISQVQSNKGDFGDKIFEVAYNDIEKEQIFLVTPDMSEYKPCSEELARRVGFEVYGHVKKLQPGHKYFSKTKTVYCLGVFKSRKSDNPYNSKFLSSLETLSDKYLLVEDLKPEWKTIQDVFKDSWFGFGNESGYEIYSPVKSDIFVDAGEVLKDDMSVGGDIRAFWPSLITKTIEHASKETKHGFKYVEDVRSVLEILCFSSPNKEDINLDPTTKKQIIESVESNLKYLIRRYWEISVRTKQLKSSNYSLDNERALKELFYDKLLDGNIQKVTYYDTLFSVIGVDLDKMVKDTVTEWNCAKNITTKGFEEYLKIMDVFLSLNLRKSSVDVDMRNKTKQYYYGSNNVPASVEGQFGKNSELTTAILEIISSADSCFGDNLEDYKIINLGTKLKPNEYVIAKVGVDDIIKHKKGVSGMSETLKNDIMGRKFRSVNVMFDKGDTVK